MYVKAAAAAAAAAVTSRSRTRTTPLRHRTVVSPDTRYTHSCTHHGPRGGRESLLSRMRMPGVSTLPPPRASSPVIGARLTPRRRLERDVRQNLGLLILQPPPAVEPPHAAHAAWPPRPPNDGGRVSRHDARRAAPWRPLRDSHPSASAQGVWPSTAAPGRLCTSGGTHWLPVSEHEARTARARVGSGSARGERSPWKWGVHRQSRSRLSCVAH